YTSLQKSVVMPGADGVARIAAYMSRLRRSPPDKFGGTPVIEWRDYAARTVVVRGGDTRQLNLPSSNVLAYELVGGSRLVIRPSGTEPKLKYYVDHREAMGPG